MFSGVFIAEEVDATGDKWSGSTKTIDVQTFLKAFLTMSLRSACFSDEAFFLYKVKLPFLGLLSPGA